MLRSELLDIACGDVELHLDLTAVSRSLPALAASKGLRTIVATESTKEIALANAIVLRCQQGDRAAEREFYDATCGWIYRLVMRLVGENDADDVCQQVYLRVFSKLHSFTGQSKATTWLYRVAVNEALQHLRRRPKTVTLAVDPFAEPDDSNQFANRELLEKALAAIDAELKTVFLLRELEQLSYREIADLLQIPEGTVASRINRARTELQAALMRLGWRPQ